MRSRSGGRQDLSVVRLPVGSNQTAVQFGEGLLENENNAIVKTNFEVVSCEL